MVDRDRGREKCERGSVAASRSRLADLLFSAGMREQAGTGLGQAVGAVRLFRGDDAAIEREGELTKPNHQNAGLDYDQLRAYRRMLSGLRH